MSNDISTRIGRKAMLLALSEDNDETELKEQLLSKNGYKATVLYIAGKSSSIQSSLMKSVVPAAMQAEIIDNKPTQIHGLLHAVLGAYNAFKQDGLVTSDLKIKVAIVTDSRWVAVAMYGNSAFYYSTSHERGSLYVMHI